MLDALIRESLAGRVVRLADGTIGYLSRRDGDCWPAALATCLQVPIGLVPDAHAVIDTGLRVGLNSRAINRRVWSQLDSWLATLGVHRVRHETLPAAERRWIGVVGSDGDVHFCHCFVMAEDNLLHDPAPEVTRLLGLEPSDCTWGFSFKARSKDARR